MALLSSPAGCQIRHSNKEPEWSSICNNVFDEYLDTNDLFGLTTAHAERNSSEDSLNLFDFSGSSEQSHETEATSTHSWDLPPHRSVVSAVGPKAKESLNFWTKTVKALERNAAESEIESQKLRSTKSHPDFLSLGGHPSPPAIPSSPTDELAFVQQRLPRAAVHNAKRRNITARSLSRGRPIGVVKPAVAGSVNPYATVRKRSVSPIKMMTPSRYRAGFQDVWPETVDTSPRRYDPRRSPSPLFCTPPPSADKVQDELAAFGFNTAQSQRSMYDEHMSPLATTFQQTHIHTPHKIPAANYTTEPVLPFLDTIQPRPLHSHPPPSAAPNDTAPLYPDPSITLTTSKIQSFDFDFSSPGEDVSWLSPDNAPSAPMYPHDDFSSADPFASLSAGILPTTETFDSNTVGLGISCDPSLVSGQPSLQNSSIVPAATYQPTTTRAVPYYIASHHPHRLETPHRRTRSCHRSQSPSPPPTEPRSSRKASSSRRPSRHRRTKSTNSTPRHPHGSDKTNGAFVNFTAEDSNRILSGVAPSGSSKTKARREKEAADKRRRLSQAAVRAVVEAGGDLDALSASGLI